MTGPDDKADWRQIKLEADQQAALHRRLTFQYGRKRADQIMAGEDQATERDLAAWRRLGPMQS